MTSLSFRFLVCNRRGELLMFTKLLLDTKYCSQHFTCNIPFNPHNEVIDTVIFSFARRGNRCTVSLWPCSRSGSTRAAL